jgi:hypothetical protein
MSYGKKQVEKVFDTFVEKLVANGYSESISTYYRRGEYEPGPVINIPASALQLFRTGDRTEWQVSYDVDLDDRPIPHRERTWRPVFFGFNNVPSGFQSNKDAYEWLTTRVAELS